MKHSRAAYSRIAACALGIAHARIIARALSTVRAVIGAPDYPRYVAHQRARHPGATPLSREEFARERERARYEGTVSRCC